MDTAPDLPPAPGFEPPESPDTGRESLPADLRPIPPLPGFMPEDYPKLVEVFPDQHGELPTVDILDDRLGNADTRQFNTGVLRGARNVGDRTGIEIDHIGGGQPERQGRRPPELYLKPADLGRAGGSYLDVAFVSRRTGRRLLINTVDTRADGVTPSSRENQAAERILRNSDTGDLLVIVPKPPRGQIYSLDHFEGWLRPILEELDKELPNGGEPDQRRFDYDPRYR